MFEDIQSRFGRILKNIRGQGKITESNVSESAREIRRALLEADVNLGVVKSFTQRVIDKATGDVVFDSIKPGQQFVKLILDELIATLGQDQKDIKIGTPVTSIVLSGLQGSGKTTTSAKLAHLLKKKHKKNPCIIAADLNRPGAVEQLLTLGKSIDVPIYYDKSGSALNSVECGMKEYKKNRHDVVIVDTAGRLHIDEELMSELKSIIDFVKPNNTFYVADSMTGQDAVNSSKSFSDLIDITGVILTKLDGDSRGGAAISITETINKPIMFSGVGEKVSDFEAFNPERVAKRILGMGDIVGLVEKAQDAFDSKESKKIEQRIKENKFDFNDFKSQLSQMKKMGSMKDIMGMMPGVGSKIKNFDMDDRKLKWVEAIINSMTPAERENPDIMNGSRRKRIANGAGRPLQEVNQLLKQFTMMKNMMKKMNKRAKFRFPI